MSRRRRGRARKNKSDGNLLLKRRVALLEKRVKVLEKKAGIVRVKKKSRPRPSPFYQLAMDAMRMPSL